MLRNTPTRIVITCRACNSFSKPLPGKFWLPFGVVQSLTLLPANSVVGVVTLDTMAVCQCDNSRNVRAISANSATCSATVQRTKTESSWANCGSKTTVDYRPKINEITAFYVGDDREDVFSENIGVTSRQPSHLTQTSRQNFHCSATDMSTRIRHHVDLTKNFV